MEFDSEMEVTAHYELDEFLRRGLEDHDTKITVLEEEGVKMDISMEDWEQDVINQSLTIWPKGAPTTTTQFLSRRFWLD